MATVTKPIALDESLNTTENPSRNIADVLAEGLDDIVSALGGGSLEDLNDVAIVTPSNGQTLKYNSTTQKWENANDAGGHTIYDPDETAMTQRAGLGFTDAHVSDNSGDDRTDISLVEAISKTDWDNLDASDASNNGLYEITDPNNSPVLDDTMVAHGNSTVNAVLNDSIKGEELVATLASGQTAQVDISQYKFFRVLPLVGGVHPYNPMVFAPSDSTYQGSDGKYRFYFCINQDNSYKAAGEITKTDTEIGYTTSSVSGWASLSIKIFGIK